jgi:hypothetical protein
MLVSDRYKFIFIHIPKVAGTSVQHGLHESICSPWELANWRIEWFLRRVNSYLIPLSHQKLCLSNPLYDEKNNSIQNPIYNEFINENYPEKAHAKAFKAKEMLGEQKWDNYFKFAFVRNPWSYVLSMYSYGRRKKQPTTNLHLKQARIMTFDDYIKTFVASDLSLQQQKDWITDEDGTIIVDYVGKFESLTEDYHQILHRVGLPQKLLPGMNIDRAKVGKSYRSFYNEQTQNVIREKYQDDISLFGYTF